MVKDVDFLDLRYTINDKSLAGGESRTRDLLKNVNGCFKRGHLSVIMGTSGAGKSTLLNTLSGYKSNGLSGTVNVNRKDSCYILQEDVHQPFLTIHEMMTVACKLKPSLSNKSTPDQIIDSILNSLHLYHRRDVEAKRLSGGERKRLSIAIELVADPSIFFLDEPTSGLDEVTAFQCVRTLRGLAQQGRTVVCTMHQPSAAIFKMVDAVYVLSQGLCVYQGAPQALVPFLNNLNLRCPVHYNPADYIIELCDSDPNLIITLSTAIENGKLTYNCIVDPMSDHVETIARPITTNMILDTSRLKPPSSLVLKMKAFTKFFKNDRSLSGIDQFFILLRLMFLKIVRNRVVLWIQLIHYLMCGIFIGLIFVNSANDGSRMFDHLKYCIACTFFTVYTQMMVPILAYPAEVKLVKKEWFNRWYGLAPYYIAVSIARLPVQTVLSLIFSALVYSMSGLPLEWKRFGLFALIGIILSISAEGVGLAIGAIFSVTNGCAMGPAIMAPLLGLAIHGFDFAPDITWFMDILMRLSFIRGGVVSMVLTVFGFDRPKLNCDDIYCHFDNPKTLLRYLRIEDRSLFSEILLMCALMLSFRVLCYYSLRRRFNK